MDLWTFVDMDIDNLWPLESLASAARSPVAKCGSYILSARTERRWTPSRRRSMFFVFLRGLSTVRNFDTAEGNLFL